MIDLLCPTRKRPHRVAQLLESAERLMDPVMPVRAYFYVDDDDGETQNKTAEITERFKRVQPVFVQGPRRCLSECWAEVYPKGSGEIVMLCGDDIVFESERWNVEVTEGLAEFPGGVGLVFGDDGISGDQHGTHPFVTRRACEALGYFVPPLFRANFNDTWLMELYRGVGRVKFLPHVKTMHHHFIKHGEWMDETYREQQAHAREADAVWRQSEPRRKADIERLRQWIAENAS